MWCRRHQTDKGSRPQARRKAGSEGEGGRKGGRKGGAHRSMICAHRMCAGAKRMTRTHTWLFTTDSLIAADRRCVCSSARRVRAGYTKTTLRTDPHSRTNDGRINQMCACMHALQGLAVRQKCELEQHRLVDARVLESCGQGSSRWRATEAALSSRSRGTRILRRRRGTRRQRRQGCVKKLLGEEAFGRSSSGRRLSVDRTSSGRRF